MNKKKREEQPKKFEVKKRAPKDKPNFFQNVTPFTHPVAEIFSFPIEEIKPETKPRIEGHNQPDQPDLNDATNDVSPKNDYTKVANSITRTAVPERLFKGMSKNTYDALYLKTRGAVNPVRKIRATRSDLIRWAGVSDVTIDKHIKHLKSVGLLKVDFVIGSHEGNWYEVFIPEEINPPNLTNLTNPTNVPKKVSNHITNFLGYVGRVDLVENKGTYGFPKTSLKTLKNDDDASASAPASALTDFAAAMNEVSRKLTKKGLSKNEKGKWKELAEILVMELELATARTGSISNVPAFLTEHLRRRLSQKPENVSGKKKVGKSLPTGKATESPDYEIQTYEAEPLTGQGRETVLKTMREYIAGGQKEFVLNLQDTYTAEDWKWLAENLEASDKK